MPEFVHPYHTNGMKFIALDKDGNTINEWLVFSVGGGTMERSLQIQEAKQEEFISLTNLMI